MQHSPKYSLLATHNVVHLLTGRPLRSLMEDLREEDVRAALISQSGSIYDSADVIQFLRQKDLYKHVGARFLCWMIRFSLIPPSRNQWALKFIQLNKAYLGVKKHRFQESQERPLLKLPESIAVVLEADTKRGIEWFTSFAQQVGIDEYSIRDAELRVQRILIAISLEYEDLSYSQGDDRFIWVSYLASLYFATRGGLNRDFAEAMAFHLGHCFVSTVTVSRQLKQMDALEKRFKKLDDLVDVEVPEVAALLNENGHKAMHYAMRWQCTLFSDDHSSFELMYIWDSVLLNLDRYEKYVRCLCVAHIKQVPVAEMSDEMAMNIQRNKSWNSVKIVEDAEDLMADAEDDEEDVGIKAALWKCFMFLSHCACL